MQHDSIYAWSLVESCILDPMSALESDGGQPPEPPKPLLLQDDFRWRGVRS